MASSIILPEGPPENTNNLVCSFRRKTPATITNITMLCNFLQLYDSQRPRPISVTNFHMQCHACMQIAITIYINNKKLLFISDAEGLAPRVLLCEYLPIPSCCHSSSVENHPSFHVIFVYCQDFSAYFQFHDSWSLWRCLFVQRQVTRTMLMKLQYNLTSSL